MVFWKSSGAADGVEHAEFVWEAGTVLEVHFFMSENLNNGYPILVLSWVSIGLQVAMITCTNPKLTVAHELEYKVARSAGAAVGENELSSLVGCGGPPSSRLRMGL